jgi:archaellum component FlaF (FlaF/FlaG flagellin family)
LTDRKTNFKTIWQRAKIRPILLLFAFQGIAFALLLFLPMGLMMNSMEDSFPFVENAEKIQSDGIMTNAVLTNIKGIDNITINGNNPQILTYEFDFNGQKSESNFSVFEPDKTDVLKTGDIISIKHLNGESIPTEFEQYSFNMDFMYYIAGAILLIGLILSYLLYSQIKKEITLYKTGRIKEGKIISISHNRGFTFSKFGSSMDVHYEYGNIVAKSRTNNFALTNNKSIGDSIKILVSQDGNTSCLYPELIAKTNGWKENYVA